MPVSVHSNAASRSSPDATETSSSLERVQKEIKLLAVDFAREYVSCGYRLTQKARDIIKEATKYHKPMVVKAFVEELSNRGVRSVRL